MVRACRPPAREPISSWLRRLSTMATSTLANASSAANISPVGPPPTITTAWSVIATISQCRPAAEGFRSDLLAQLLQLMGQDARKQPWDDDEAQLPKERERVQLEPVLLDASVDEAVELDAGERDLPPGRR